MIVRPGLTAADDGKNEASTTKRLPTSCVRQNVSSTEVLGAALTEGMQVIVGVADAGRAQPAGTPSGGLPRTFMPLVSQDWGAVSEWSGEGPPPPVGAVTSQAPVAAVETDDPQNDPLTAEIDRRFRRSDRHR